MAPNVVFIISSLFSVRFVAGALVCNPTPNTALCAADFAVVNTLTWATAQTQAGMSGYLASTNKMGAVKTALAAGVPSGQTISDACLNCQAAPIVCGFTSGCMGSCLSAPTGYACRVCNEKKCFSKKACGGVYGTSLQLPWTVETGATTLTQNQGQQVVNEAEAAQADTATGVTCATATTTGAATTTLAATTVAASSAYSGSYHCALVMALATLAPTVWSMI